MIRPVSHRREVTPFPAIGKEARDGRQQACLDPLLTHFVRPGMRAVVNTGTQNRARFDERNLQSGFRQHISRNTASRTTANNTDIKNRLHPHPVTSALEILSLKFAEGSNIPK